MGRESAVADASRHWYALSEEFGGSLHEGCRSRFPCAKAEVSDVSCDRLTMWKEETL